METATWTTTHNHTTGDFVCEFNEDVKVSVSMNFKKAYVTHNGNVVDNFSIEDMTIEAFHNILLNVAKVL